MEGGTGKKKQLESLVNKSFDREKATLNLSTIKNLKIQGGQIRKRCQKTDKFQKLDFMPLRFAGFEKSVFPKFQINFIVFPRKHKEIGLKKSVCV